MFRAIACFALFFGIAAAPVCARTAEFMLHPVSVPEMKAVFGQVESRIVVAARARIGGNVQEIRIREGDHVEEGQIIAWIVDDKLALQLDAINARIGALDSQLTNARTQLERAEQLKARGTGSQADLDQARMRFEVATREVTALNAERAVIEQNMKEGEIVAPVAGRVLSVPVTPGSVMLAGEEAARIAPGPYYLRLSLPERHAAEIVQGAQVLVAGRGLRQSPDDVTETRRGRIVRVYPEITAGRVTADVEIEGIGDYFVNERMLVSIPIGKRTVLAVPPQTIRMKHGVEYVRVIGEGGESDVAVIPGETFDEGGESRVEILSGLKAGDRLVLP